MFDAVAVAEWAASCVRSLDRLRADIDGINVYPVADGDTGSNLLHTLTGARDALAAEPEPIEAGRALGVLARGAVAAARGNSGVIVSQVLRGFAEASAGVSELDGRLLAEALGRADAAATKAVARPVRGTMLTVLSAAAWAAEGGTDLREVAASAARAAAAALERTPSQLPVLASAGVVDAGGRGLVAVLDALLAVVTGERTEPSRGLAAEEPARPRPAPHTWEVMYLLTGVDDAGLPGLRAALSGLGDSVTVAGDGAGSHAVHVHCADIGAAIEAGIEIGRPHRIRVEPLLTPGRPDEPPARENRAVVAVVHGAELAGLVGAEGVPVLAVPFGSLPTAEELLGLITETGVGHVTVLPGGLDLTGAADEVAGHAMLEDRDVVVIPCASPVQVLAALAVHDTARRTNDDVVAMAEAAAATRRGELRLLAEDAITWVGRAHAGDAVGLVDGEVVSIEPAGEDGPDTVAAAIAVLRRMLDVGGELVTLLSGEGTRPDVAEAVADALRAERPDVELAWYPGGDIGAVLLIGVE
ncbi:dihydroxyacetone kinase [Amycolatopsis antarctica]|uniref:Dihydroxyacetone kinase n=1 Tax=Amycolatopsis antarctica TaxID=1854586 RepID=A0A263D6N4_9PSEU|nr:DAK2 domain-containing protein [Amycolatopsis antarctica]OZM74073.1 dihydroxyacetone kinase [Amycolatopsis antarctica]